MKRLGLRLPDELHDLAVARAEEERRSLNTMLVIAIERGLSERTGAATPARTVSEVGAPAQEHGVAEVPVAVRSESDTHFKPDPKPGKAEKKGRR